MSKLDEIYRLHRPLDGWRTGLPRAALIAEHGFSRFSLSRLIADLRDKLGALLIHDKDRGGYHYDTASANHVAPCSEMIFIAFRRAEIERPEASLGSWIRFIPEGITLLQQRLSPRKATTALSLHQRRRSTPWP